jgi:hypothetical protein
MNIINEDGSAVVGGVEVVREYQTTWRDGAVIRLKGGAVLPWADAGDVRTNESGGRIHVSRFILPDGRLGVWELHVSGPDWSDRAEWIGLVE